MNLQPSADGTRLGFRAHSILASLHPARKFPSPPRRSGWCTHLTSRTTSPLPQSSLCTAPSCPWWWSSRGSSSAKTTNSSCSLLEECLWMVEVGLRLYFEAPALMRPYIFGSTLMRSRKPRLYKYLIKYSGSSNFGRTFKIKQLGLWENPAMEHPLDEINPLWSSNIWLFENTFVVHSLSGSLATLMVGFWGITRRRAIQPFFILFNQLTSRMFRFYC